MDKGMVERGVAKLVPGVNRCTMFQQELNNLEITLRTS